jgi:hypothetical protein
MKKAIKNNINLLGAIVFAIALCFPLTSRFVYIYSDQFAQVKEVIEKHFSHPPQETLLKRLFWDYLKITNRRYINGVIVMNDGRLIFDFEYDLPQVSKTAEEIIALNDYLKASNTPFLFLRAPDAMRDNSQMPRGFENTVIEDGAWFMAKLRENGVDTLDLREIMTNENIDFSTAFFRGDLHWTTETSLWAYGKIATLMNSEYDFNLDAKTWNPQEYKTVTYNKKIEFMAARIGDPRLGENISVLIPKFPTEFIASAKTLDESKGNESNIIAVGDFVDVFVPLTKNENVEMLAYSSLNSARANSNFNEYHNLSANEHKKVLLIADSYGVPIATYLASALEYVDYLYLDINGNNFNIYPFLDRENYDMVLFLAYDGNLLGDGPRLSVGKP